jgi:ABC-type multidrug transport system permease subunit
MIFSCSVLIVIDIMLKLDVRPIQNARNEKKAKLHWYIRNINSSFFRLKIMMTCNYLLKIRQFYWI